VANKVSVIFLTTFIKNIGKLNRLHFHKRKSSGIQNYSIEKYFRCALFGYLYLHFFFNLIASTAYIHPEFGVRFQTQMTKRLLTTRLRLLVLTLWHLLSLKKENEVNFFGSGMIVYCNGNKSKYIE
jgi:hypothetical protein